MTSGASTPASTPTRTHVTNMAKLMTFLLHPVNDSPASLPLRRCARRDLRAFAPVGWMRAHQDGREHLDRPLVEGTVVDDHLHSGACERPYPLGRRGGTDDGVHSPYQATQRGALGRARPGQRDVRQAGVRDRVLQVVG